MGWSWSRYGAIALLMGAIAACSDEAAEWFAADPSLTGTSLSGDGAAPEPAEPATLPADFPDGIPRYPGATLVAVRTAEATAAGDRPAVTTQWQTTATRAEVEAFYTEQFRAQTWQRRPAPTGDGTLVARREDLEVQVSFLEEMGTGARFVLIYEQGLEPLRAPTAPAAEAVSSPETSASFRDLDSLTAREVGYIRDLQALGVFADLGPQFQPSRVVTRQEFARWLFGAHNRMYRDRPTKQIRPVAQAAQPAFEDVKPDAPGFAEIQGLAEAGIIPSRLTGDTAALLFQPEAPLTREQAIAWKVPLDLRRLPPPADLEAIRNTWGFQDAEQLDARVRRALLADYENGDRANVLRAFGYTTLFQPRKPLTRAEAAALLWQFGHQGEGISAAEALALPEEGEPSAPREG